MGQGGRRQFLVAATAFFGILLAPLTSLESGAQTTGRIYRVGVLLVGKPLPPDALPAEISRRPGLRALLDHLAERGYTQGKNLAVELRVGEYEQLAVLAAELVRLKVDVIFASGTKAARIAQDAVKTTPLVIYSCDPFEHVTRLARPDKNVTGSTCMTTELSPKRLELLKELLPKASRVIFFGDPEDAPLGWKLTRDAAPRLGIKLEEVEYKGRDGIPAALNAIAKKRPDAVSVYPDAVLFAEREQLADFALSHGLPTMHAFPEFVEAGGLMSYGASTVEMHVMLAEQVAQILDGARPSDVPVRRATRFHLVINMKTAKALGVTVPPSVLARADRVIE